MLMVGIVIMAAGGYYYNYDDWVLRVCIAICGGRVWWAGIAIMEGVHFGLSWHFVQSVYCGFVLILVEGYATTVYINVTVVVMVVL